MKPEEIWSKSPKNEKPLKDRWVDLELRYVDPTYIAECDPTGDRVMTKEQKLLIEYNSLIGYTDGVFSTLIDQWDLPEELIVRLKASLTTVRNHGGKLDDYFKEL